MNTEPRNNQTRSEPNPHKAELGPNTNPVSTYEVTFILTQRSSGSLLIDATSLEEAQEKANQIQMNEVNNWDIYEDEMTVESVELIEEGQSDE